MGFGMPLENLGVAVPADGRGVPRTRRRLGEVRELLGRILGDEQPRVGTRRQTEAVLNLLNCAFMGLTGPTLEVAEPHHADSRGGGQVGERPVPGLTQSPDRRARGFPAHRPDPVGGVCLKVTAESYTT